MRLHRTALSLVTAALFCSCGGGDQGSGVTSEDCDAPSGFPASLARPNPLPAPLPCSAEPNFKSDVQQLHWRQSDLPLSPHFAREELPFTTYLDIRSIDDVDGNTLGNGLVRVFSHISEWERPVGIDFFADTDAPNISDADVPLTYSWAAGDTKGSAARTNIRFNADTGEIATAHVEVDSTDAVIMGTAFAHEVLIHKTGHALGVLGHSPSDRHVMAPSGRSCDDARSRVMTAADVHTLAAGYCEQPSAEGLGATARRWSGIAEE